jgi:hypothetical protein
MPLKLRPTGLGSGIDKDRSDAWKAWAKLEEVTSETIQAFATLVERWHPSIDRLPAKPGVGRTCFS